MSRLTFLLAISFCIGCVNNSTFEKSFYERTTGIKFPRKYEVLETIDNGEFITATVLKIDNGQLKSFIESNGFKELSKQDTAMFISREYLKSYLPDFSKNSLLVLAGSKGKNNWFYIVDTSERKLWAQVDYPDWGGN